MYSTVITVRGSTLNENTRPTLCNVRHYLSLLDIMLAEYHGLSYVCMCIAQRQFDERLFM